MKGSDGWLLHALNSKHLCVWVCRHHAKWWTPSCMVSQLSLRPWGEGLIQAARRRYWAKFQNWGGTYVQIFGYFGYLCGLKWVKICWQIDTKENCLDGHFWVRVTRKMLNVNWEKNSINNFIFHLWWLKKLFVTHIHPLETICEFLKPYELLFFELESLVKCWMWIGNKFNQ